jgi:hypothetical protein
VAQHVDWRGVADGDLHISQIEHIGHLRQRFTARGK